MLEFWLFIMQDNNNIMFQLQCYAPFTCIQICIWQKNKQGMRMLT